MDKIKLGTEISSKDGKLCHTQTYFCIYQIVSNFMSRATKLLLIASF